MKTEAMLRQSTALSSGLEFEQKDSNQPSDPTAAIELIATSFEAFRKSHDEQIAELKKGVNDPVLLERLSKIEKSLDDGAEAKQKIEGAIAAERKEREELELRLQRFGIKGDGDAAKAEVELKLFNIRLQAQAAEQKTQVAPLDMKGYEEYKGAFAKFLRKNNQLLSADEVKTLSVGSDPDGGYLVTPDITGRMVKKIYETSPIRRIASIQTISTDALEGMEDLGEAGCGYAGEHSTSGDTTTPQLGKWRIETHIIDTEPKATQQLLDDAEIDVEGWLADKVGNKFGRFENSEFVNGAANKIRGFAAGYSTAADDGTGVTWGTLGYIASGASGDFAASTPADKLHDIVGALKVDYLEGAAFVTRRTVITKIRKFKDGQNQYLWQPSLVLGAPETLLSHPLVRAEDMPAIAANSFSLAFGNFNEGYQIVDRQAIRVLRDPFTSKPYVKFYTTKRVGGAVINFEAIKLMKFAAS
ncbi:phage major capsid protein [Sphingobium sp. CFD-2]|uniref:phage major capsid protein n=1 Tax=Sphingobium sp. CFD-2 TaxID=2878542 RepID=UPI00214B2B28|nr:phage major capsid protein [Sphingobium sp. CFD-2]